jgi:hypothetical protein
LTFRELKQVSSPDVLPAEITDVIASPVPASRKNLRKKKKFVLICLDLRSGQGSV